MKICYVTDTYPPNIGGAEYVIQNIVEGVAKYGIDTVVITTRPRTGQSQNVSFDEKNIIRIRIPYFLKRFWFMLFSIPVILRHSREADLIHGTSYGGIIPSFVAGKLLRKPIVITVHEFMGRNWFKYSNSFISAFYYMLAEKIFSKLSFKKFIAVSNYTKSKLLEAGITENKIKVIYNGESNAVINGEKPAQEIRNKLGIKTDELVFAAYGRTGLTKGFEYLVDAIPYVLNEVNNAKFLLIFTPDDRKIWKRILEKIHKIDRSRVLFYTSMDRTNLFNYLNASDIIIIPSLSEGFGYTTLEAVALNKRIIATNIGSIPEVISGKHILIKPHSVEEIISACFKAAQNDFTNKEPNSFSWNNSVNSYVDLYKEIINLSS